MTGINRFTDDELSGIGIGPEHGIALERFNKMIDGAPIIAKCTGLNLLSATDEVSAQLNGVVDKRFVPVEVLVVCASVAGTPANATIDVGVSTGDDSIDADAAVSALTAAGMSLRLPVSAAMPAIAGNATLYVSVHTVGITATTFTADIYIIGRQF